MKSSNYNFFYPLKDSDEYIAYNALTQALATIDTEHYEEFQKFAKYEETLTDSKFVESLKKGAFIIDDTCDELQLLKLRLFSSRYSSRSLSITIAPTTECNFSCIYCYEKSSNKDSKMTKEVQDGIIEFVKQNIKYIDNLSIAWYGGEPLLALDVIEYLSKNLIDMCNKENVTYNSSIITNGYKLTKEVALKLKDLKVNMAQITIDGVAEIHNTRRPLAGGQPTFDVILNNVKNCLDILDMSIRINTDKENYTKLENLLTTIKEYGINKLPMYLGYVEPTNDCYVKSTCMNYDEFSDLSFNFQNLLIEKGFMDKDSIYWKYPQMKANYCGADCNASIIIAPKGDLYKCWSDVGIKKFCVGNLLDKSNESNKIYNRLFDFMLYDPTEDRECNECSYLPICMGGCPRRRIDKMSCRCLEYKYNLNLYLEKIANMLYEKSKEAV